jgi:hypothetical protein
MPITEEKRLEVLARLNELRKMEERRKKDLEEERRRFLEKFKKMTKQERMELIDKMSKEEIF